MMVECECGKISNPRNIVRIGDYVLVVEIQDGCEFCKNDVMVNLHLFTPEVAASYGFETEDVMDPGEFGRIALHIPIVGREDLIDAYANRLLFTYVESLEDWFLCHGRRLLQEAVNIRQDHEDIHVLYDYE